MYNLVSGEYDIYIISIISAFVLALVAGPVFIPVLRRMKFGQIVRDDGPQSHLKKKRSKKKQERYQIVHS